mgnify:CR=1 FL=1|jgi:hypothetical protein|tara:strand:- start:797 stop:955 length:159 start_codon:yes stop_codon:yes gene_type:complete
METTNTISDSVKGSSTNDSRRKYNFTDKKKKTKKLKTMMDITRNAKKDIKLK